MVLSAAIENHVLSLPLEERARLADKLLTSLQAPVEAGWFTDLDSEVSARMDAAKRGEITSRDREAVLGEMWNLLRQ